MARKTATLTAWPTGPVARSGGASRRASSSRDLGRPLHPKAPADRPGSIKRTSDHRLREGVSLWCCQAVGVRIALKVVEAGGEVVGGRQVVVDVVRESGVEIPDLELGFAAGPYGDRGGFRFRTARSSVTAGVELDLQWSPKSEGSTKPDRSGGGRQASPLRPSRHRADQRSTTLHRPRITAGQWPARRYSHRPGSGLPNLGFRVKPVRHTRRFGPLYT